MSFTYCADDSLGIGEPLAGSAIASTDRFLVLEHAIPWGPKGVDDSELPPDVVAWLGDLAARHRRLRVQLIREMGSEPSDVRRVFFAETGEQGGRLSALTVHATEALLALDVDGWLRGDQPAPGVPEHEPLYLVCVHGKRDRCCARLGLPVYRALREIAGDRVHQTTHLGGHRFAATLLVLPAGVCYGRVAPEEAEALIAASAGGELHDLDRVRGRTAYPSAAQAAEVALRQQLSERRADALHLIDVRESDEDGVAVRFQVAGSEHTIALRREALPPSPASCGAAPKAGSCLVPLTRLSSASG
jgi:hypothetical protein